VTALLRCDSPIMCRVDSGAKRWVQGGALDSEAERWIQGQSGGFRDRAVDSRRERWIQVCSLSNLGTA
jgi:hypothetical protein